MSPEKLSDIPTTSRWWQTKRVPLYLVVAGTGVYYFAYLRHQGTKDPSVVAGTADLAGDPAAAAAQGDKYKSEAPSKKMLNAAGMAGGQDTGIFPNAKITKKLDEAGVLPGGGDWKPRT